MAFKRTFSRVMMNVIPAQIADAVMAAIITERIFAAFAAAQSFHVSADGIQACKIQKKSNLNNERRRFDVF